MIKSFLDAYVQWMRRLLPSPMAIALLLTVCAFAAVFIWSLSVPTSSPSDVLEWWGKGLWKPDLLAFAVQMMLMLVLGHVMALSPPVSKLIDNLLAPCTNTSKAAAFVALAAMLVALLNWGLGLIFGAIMARRVAEKSSNERFPINYPIIGAAGYASMLIWHGGISGSALIKVAEPGHLQSLVSSGYASQLPLTLHLGETVFSTMNIATCSLLMLVVPTMLYFLGAVLPASISNITPEHSPDQNDATPPAGAEKLDQHRWPAAVSGSLILMACVFIAFSESTVLAYFTPNHINLLLLGLALLGHSNLASFTKASEEAIRGASAILIQFPLYFGLLALMSESGCIDWIAQWFTQNASKNSFPLMTFFSASLINLFIPSGGGQWAVQGPVIIQSSIDLGAPLYKSILAMAYGDQLTNMLQPFWALPLLGITKLEARDILPFTLLLFLAGLLVFLIGITLL